MRSPLLFLDYHRLHKVCLTYTKSAIEVKIQVFTQLHPAMSSVKSRLVVLVDSEIKSDFEKICEIENRSMSNQAETLIKNFIESAKREGKFTDRTNGKKS
jgi:hypothetical protein